MGRKVNKKSFVIQGSILAIAGILVRVIGLIYRIPLTRILGDEGNGYYSTAYDIYNILILLSSQSMPLAVSKIVSETLSRRQFKNTHKVFKGALVFATIIGVVFGLFAFLGADWLATVLYKTPPAAMALKVLAPTLTIACFLGVMRGFFQGMGDMVPTAISQVFEQIINAAISVIAAYELGIYIYTANKMSGMSGAALLTSKAEWGAAGGTLGTLSGALTALLVIIIFFFVRYKKLKQQRLQDTTNYTDSYGKIAKILFFTITPVLLSTTIYNISNLIDNPVFQNIMDSFTGVKETVRASLWGVYSAKYRVLTTMPIAISTALSTAMVPSLVRSYTEGSFKVLKNKVSLALKVSMLIAFPCGVGLSVLGGPINDMLFGDTSVLTRTMMMFSVFTVVAFSMSTITNAILQGIDRLSIPIKNAAISIVLHFIILPILLIVFKLGIYSVVISDALFAFTVCILNHFSLKKYINYKFDFFNTLVRPLLCSVVMGMVCFFTYKLLIFIIPSVIARTIISIVVGGVVYGLSLIITKTITREELESIPKGDLVIKVLEKVKLI